MRKESPIPRTNQAQPTLKLAMIYLSESNATSVNTMNQDSAHRPVFAITYNLAKDSLEVDISWAVILAGIVLLSLTVILFLRQSHLSKLVPVDMAFEFSGTPKITYTVKRNSTNLYIANRIYLELKTRKSTTHFDPDHDVLVEVYDSWYDLFGIIREEIKSVPGEFLLSHDPTAALIGLTTDILNKGLRPHLTTYQAKFRKWYKTELEKEQSKNLSPQEIQKRYPEFDALAKDILNVNKVLEDYSKELLRLIKG
jgi:hypothetical protein